jgi:hypothetical protein
MCSSPREILPQSQIRLVNYLLEFLKFYPQFTTSLVRAMCFDNTEEGLRQWWIPAAETVRRAGDPEDFFERFGPAPTQNVRGK